MGFYPGLLRSQPAAVSHDITCNPLSAWKRAPWVPVRCSARRAARPVKLWCVLCSQLLNSPPSLPRAALRWWRRPVRVALYKARCDALPRAKRCDGLLWSAAFWVDNHEIGVAVSKPPYALAPAAWAPAALQRAALPRSCVAARCGPRHIPRHKLVSGYLELEGLATGKAEQYLRPKSQVLQRIHRTWDKGWGLGKDVLTEPECWGLLSWDFQRHFACIFLDATTMDMNAGKPKRNNQRGRSSPVAAATRRQRN